jgi:hypothetical protein
MWHQQCNNKINLWWEEQTEGQIEEPDLQGGVIELKIRLIVKEVLSKLIIYCLNKTMVCF